MKDLSESPLCQFRLGFAVLTRFLQDHVRNSTSQRVEPQVALPLQTSVSLSRDRCGNTGATLSVSQGLVIDLN